jgi:ribosomal protein S18 acetylase RimI-like enzyme
MIPEFVIRSAESSADIASLRDLFLEYANSLGFSLCFQSFDQELASLPGVYAAPNGRLLLAEIHGEVAGCVALHQLDEEISEIKRLYVRPQFRGKRLGRSLAEHVISEAQAIGYKRVRLDMDTVEPTMKAALGLYFTLGFREIAPYSENPIEGAMYLELEL